MGREVVERLDERAEAVSQRIRLVGLYVAEQHADHAGAHEDRGALCAPA